ncbi:MAG: 3-phosphoshikimate 1-carboxyvinyltransferase [Tannerellaceae bacterium]|jgi:3-phosphoshikimate 1-carboxyvinyltransferase|nr:3-phosphoshikimate 1-carboxyvinyltransferase [Tannerellaceae bacterium]
MKYLIKAHQGAPIYASIQPPSSKSITNRALILRALTKDAPVITNPSDSDDTRVLAQALTLEDSNIDIGAAGTAMRFLTAFFSITDGDRVLTGSERMKKRPLGILVDALRALGADISYYGEVGFPPLRIRGRRLRGGSITLPGSVSSQYISAIMMIAPVTERGITITLEGTVVSAPYINMTASLMQKCGAIIRTDGRIIEISPSPYIPSALTVEADWSAASYWYLFTALSRGAHIRLTGLYPDSLQGDSACKELSASLGVESEYGERCINLKHTNNRAGHIEHNFADTPDLAQTFVTACIALGITFRFTGLESLRIKETDRIRALCTEAARLGYILKASGQGILEWTGLRCTPDPQPVIRTYDDHRMAMSFAPLALVLEDGIWIDEPCVVSKSYPAFWDHLSSAGFQVITSNK